jgi:hypothetical protein
MDQISVIGVFISARRQALSLARSNSRANFLTEFGLGSSMPMLFPTEVPHATVQIRGLLLSCYVEVIAIFSDLLREFNIYVQRCEKPSRAIEQLRSWKFDVLILDFDQVPNCSGVLIARRNPLFRQLFSALCRATLGRHEHNHCYFAE